jgi:hypothetical protein
MAKRKWKVYDGPLKGEVYALDAESCDGGRKSIDINFDLADGQVAVYRTQYFYSEDVLRFVGIGPLA